MAAEQIPDVRRRRLGYELRRLREGARVSLEEAADILECHRSKISRIELGYLGIRSRDVRDLLDAYGVTDETLRSHLTELARSGSTRPWWEAYGAAITPEYANYLGLESDAESLRTFETILVPGLLQTDAYSAAVIRANPRLDEQTVQALLRVRAERLSAVTRPHRPLGVRAVIGEAALRTPIGGVQVMTAQLDYLTEVGDQANVTLQVLPFSVGAHAGLCGPFTLFSFAVPEGSGMVYLEALTSSHYLEAQETLTEYASVFDSLSATALGPTASVEFITKIRDELKR